MATLNEYRCRRCGHTEYANPRGYDYFMMGRMQTPVPDKCPKCGEKMVKTNNVMFAD